MAPCQEANNDDLGIFFDFLHSNGIASTSTYNIQFHDKIRKFPKIFFFLDLSEEFRRDSKVRNSFGERIIGGRATEVRLFV